MPQGNFSLKNNFHKNRMRSFIWGFTDYVNHIYEDF